MHTMWKGSISFGLVNIPIKLFAATEDKDIKLRSLHKECRSPIQYEKKCSNCHQEVAPDDIVKGYEYVKGKYVVLTDDELKQLKEEQEDKSVEIVDFVQLKEIDPIYFNRSYFVGPGDNGVKAYTLLREALRKTEKIGIAHMTIRSKKQLAILRVYENCILMESIHYPDEVRNAAHVPGVPEATEVNQKELQTAISLIDELTTTFAPEQYEDTYRLAVMDKIKEKIDQNEGVTPDANAAPREDVIDLVSALQASIERSKTPQKQEKKAKTAEAQGTVEKKRKTTRKKATEAK
ncbi:Ku protein [Bacillus swezeyi]|uniref:Non-homologous end joining protein Ku n=1 Tax=Bacillus swezeyi TaxID=1925020 RepID=A0A1R1RFH3_9BACI|nr:Ku protein [Bacillus swezeyi]MEC1262408.1 Ku protein [Bacillus swezeyi]MED2926883.1 Ku protein [Bacillus swezeyi]MED2943339.1 Ku protein [Bacillus swezeyi]MED2965555.1 Ku protein [Bacillus swezeyi]MED2978177.1 Ku protein [Bacillus swezeyi]